MYLVLGPDGATRSSAQGGGSMGMLSLPLMVGPTSKVSEMSSVPTRPEKDLVEVRSPTSSYLSVALLLENSGTVLAKLPDALYKILLMVKEAEKRPDAPGTDLMKPWQIETSWGEVSLKKGKLLRYGGKKKGKERKIHLLLVKGEKC